MEIRPRRPRRRYRPGESNRLEERYEPRSTRRRREDEEHPEPRKEVASMLSELFLGWRRSLVRVLMWAWFFAILVGARFIYKGFWIKGAFVVATGLLFEVALRKPTLLHELVPHPLIRRLLPKPVCELIVYLAAMVVLILFGIIWLA
jgi:hypothetical protein